MKKITSFLMVLFVALGAMAQDAEMETYDFKNWPDNSVQLATSDKVGTAWNHSNSVLSDVYQCTTPGLERFAFQGYSNNANGKGYWLRVGHGLTEVGATRAMAILNLSAGDLVTIYTTGGDLNLDGGGDGVGTWAVKTDGNNYIVTMLTDGHLGMSFNRSGTKTEPTRYYITSITIEPDAVDVDAPVAVTGISLNKVEAAIPEGMTVNLLAATVEPVNATDQTVTWASSAENIATVDNGVVTGLVPGKATITATASGFSATCEVTVTEKASKTSWDFAALYETYGNKAGMTYAVNTVKIGGADCNYGIGEYEGLAAQGANGWFLYVDGGLYNGNSGYRNLGVLDLKEGQIVTVVANTETELTLADTNTATQLSVETVGGKSTYIYGMIADGALALKMVRNKVIISIKVEDARELVVAEGEDFAPEYDAYSSATYTRTIAEGAYGTICLPFAPDAASLENYTFFKMESAGADAINFVEETTPVANTPYIYCLKGENVAITGGATVVSADINSVEVGNWTMKGSFTKQTIATAGADTKYYGYVADQNKIVKANKTLTVLPYRAYFTAPVNAAAVALRITRGDETTEITAADLDVQPATVIYDLAGRRVEKMEKGIYIVNGKKVIR